MINRDVAAAFNAITTITDMATFEFAEKLSAFNKSHIFFFPQCERADWGGGITPAIFAMTVTHLQRFAAHLNLNCSAVTSACMFIRHEK